jgi:hypothetical protein
MVPPLVSIAIMNSKMSDPFALIPLLSATFQEYDLVSKEETHHSNCILPRCVTGMKEVVGSTTFVLYQAKLTSSYHYTRGSSKFS